MHFSASECKVLLRDWIDARPNLSLSENELNEINKFFYCDSFISRDDLGLDEVSSHAQKARLRFPGFKRTSHHGDT